MSLIDALEPRVRRTREEQRAETRQRLLAAAWTLFKEVGYHALTAEQITAHAGYSTTPLYTMFGSKEQLFIQLYAELVEQVEQRARDLGPPGRPLRETLFAYAAFVEGSLADEEFAAQIELAAVISTFGRDCREQLIDLEEVPARHRASMAAALVRYAEAAGEPLPLPAERMAALLLGSATGATVMAMTNRVHDVSALRDLIDLLCPDEASSRGI